jgi:hypothetical protein
MPNRQKKKAPNSFCGKHPYSLFITTALSLYNAQLQEYNYGAIPSVLSGASMTGNTKRNLIACCALLAAGSLS